MMIREMAAIEKPREKALHYGIETLSNAELLALLLRCGTKSQSALELAQMILSQVGGMNQLPHLSLNELTSIKGIKNAKALEILGCIELAKRMQEIKDPIHMILRSDKDVYEYMRMKLAFDKQEKFMVIYLDTKSQIIKEKVIFIGTLDGSIVHPREVYKEAISCSAAAIICIHNHPSGHCEPSPADIETTRNLNDVGNLMGIPLLDHVILTKNAYFSFKAHQLVLK